MSTIQTRFRLVNDVVCKYSATLIAVSKLKPAQDISALYEIGHLDFGENYIQEMETKARQLPKDINWHFIGHMQSNKCKVIADLIKDGYKLTVHTIDSIKLAKKLNKAIDGHTLDVLVQVNTSHEESKSGLDENECKSIVDTIVNECCNLNLIGLMCIGAPNQPTPNPDFQLMNKLKRDLQNNNKPLKLSMGMSNDFELALQQNSNYVRVGSKIFGSRK